MSELTVITPVAGEETNLELHTELCAQRYNQLIAKFDEVDGRLTKIEHMVTDIHHTLGALNTEKFKTYLTWAGIVIMTLVTFTASLVTYVVTN
jgi:hypothetical protein